MSFPDDLMHLIRTDEPLGRLVWLGIGGPARYFAEPVEEDDVVRLVEAAEKADLPVRILGGGSNVLVREAGVDGLVISLGGVGANQMSIDDTTLTVGAGTKLSHAVIKSVGAGLGGLEHLVGIPGTVGGAIVGNASSDGRDIGSVVESVTVLEKGKTRTLTQQEAGFSHRKSSLGGLMILKVTFRLEQREVEGLTKRMQKLWIGCNASRPSDDPSRIAIPFIDPDGMPAKDLLQSVGLAGIREGDVSLDATQPDYMVAHSGATSDQCLRLIERVREQVLLQTGIDLQLNLHIW